MNFFSLLTLFGGLAMFLYGMRLMGEGLKESSSGTLKMAMEHVTNNPLKAFLLGLVITALIQSSTATIVITSGLVGAGILTLHQSLGIVIGANVGTTVTGQIIRLLDLDTGGGAQWLQLLKPSSLAPLALIIGIVLIMGGRFHSAHSIGNIAIGFGILFSGLLNMTGAVDSLASSGIVESMFAKLGDNPVIGYLTGAGIAFVLQSSSATIGILQAFSASGLLTFRAIYAVIVGIYLGDCVTTAIVCSIGATAESRRVGIVNILFNLSETVVVLLVVTILHKAGFLGGLWDRTVNSGMIANTNTIFNLGCAVVLFPMIGIYEKLSRRIIPEEPVPENPYSEKLDALNPVFFNTPALALGSCYEVLLCMFGAARENIRRSLHLIRSFHADEERKLRSEEDNIDLMADRISKYIIQLLPHLKQEYHVNILNQYYKTVGEYEHLGDVAEDIADSAEELKADGNGLSATALRELSLMEEMLEQILGYAELAFAKRDLEAACKIEPLEQVVDDMVNVLKAHHLKRMSTGECSIYDDSDFINILNSMKRIAAICSNVGVATIIRVNPELADQEHNYVARLHSGSDAEFNAEYDLMHARYFERLNRVYRPAPPDASK